MELKKFNEYNEIDPFGEENWEEIENDIPTDDHNFIVYGGYVYLIKLDNNGKYVKFQADGGNCRLIELTGFLEEKFISDNNYFNPEYWCKKTGWGIEYPEKIYFDERDRANKIAYNMSLSNKSIDFFYKKMNSLADQYAISSENVLNEIINEAIENTLINLEFDFKDKSYGKYWMESYVPVIDENNNKYVITWENCD